MRLTGLEQDGLHARLKLQDSKKAKPYVHQQVYTSYVDFTFCKCYQHKWWAYTCRIRKLRTTATITITRIILSVALFYEKKKSLMMMVIVRESLIVDAP